MYFHLEPQTYRNRDSSAQAGCYFRLRGTWARVLNILLAGGFVKLDEKFAFYLSALIKIGQRIST